MRQRKPTKEKKNRKPSPYRRKLHIDGEVWTWDVGKKTIVVSSPDGATRLRWTLAEFFGVPPDEIEWAHWKGSSAYNVTPRLVKRRIEVCLAIDKFTAKANKRFNKKAYERRKRVGRGYPRPFRTDYEYGYS